MLALFHSNNSDDFHNIFSLSSLLPHSFTKTFQSDIISNDNKEISLKKTAILTPLKPSELVMLPQNSPNKKEIPQSLSLSFEFNDDSFSEILSTASTSASSSLDFLPSSPSPKPQNLNDNPEINITDKKQRKRKCVLKVSYKKKFKTEICKFWSETGSCKYGEECAFAHGSLEMREKIHTASNYKSKKCVQYHENGYCVYGTRCHFIHSLREDAKKNPSLIEDSYLNDLENIDIWCNQYHDCVCKRRDNRTRLSCFSKLAICSKNK